MPPGELRQTASDAASITFEARDADGIYSVEAWYALPNLTRHRYFGTPAVGCPATLTVTLPRQRRVDGRTLILREVTILDCSHRNTGSHGQSTFGIDAQGRVERLRDSEIPFDAQKQREVMMEIQRRVDDVERRLRQLLALLLLLLLLGLWAALGPLFF